MIRRRYLRNRARGNIVYPGLIAAWSAKGKSNDDADRATLKDLTGNGHDITLNGFAFSEMSGYGGIIPYKIAMSGQFIVNSEYKINKAGNKIEISFSSNGKFHQTSLKPNEETKPFKVKIIGVDENVYIAYVDYGGESILFKKNGIYDIPIAVNNTEYNLFPGFRLNKNNVSCNITFEILPEYPDALVFDGVDDYGINENMPILTDYTIIAKRKLLNYNSQYSCFIRKGNGDANDAFWFERPNNTIFNFGLSNNVEIEKSDISWQTSALYNGQNINKGNSVDYNQIFIGGKTIAQLYGNAFYSAYLFDRSLDEQEIKAFIRKYIDADYLLPSEIPTPDAYYDFTNGDNTAADRDTIKDLSGNGNNAAANGFAWNEEGSGYKDGALYFDGIDDYVSLDAFDSGFKTVFILFKFFNLDKMVYDQRSGTNDDFAIYTQNEVAYYARNKNQTYINGKLNTKVKTNNMQNKKNLVHIISETNPPITPKIGENASIGGFNGNMALYKFLGFKEELTEEQINTIIKKYNLLDGVDEIEVS